MCGIIGAITRHDVVPILINGLQRLEYRGYDSAGIAVLNGGVQRVRTIGRVAVLRQKVAGQGIHGLIGIGHTRWATHGTVSETNAHPHVSNGQIAVVHNGIIENHERQRARLSQLGYAFESQTDTEVIAHLVHLHFKLCGNLADAVRGAVRELEGAYAIGVMALADPDTVISARMGCPLLIGSSDDGSFLASDVSALLDMTRYFVHLEDGDVATLRRDGVTITDRAGAQVQRKPTCSKVSVTSLELGSHACFMHKEIHEQPVALRETVRAALVHGLGPGLFGKDADVLFRDVNSVLILAAGTSFHAGLIAKCWIETLARIPVVVDIASEYRYRQPIMNSQQLVVAISQSGETLDTLEALKHAREFGHERTLAICNVLESTIPRASRLAFYTKAGIEIGVASTKAFTTQLVALYMLALVLAKQRSLLDETTEADCLKELGNIAAAAQKALTIEPQIEKWSQLFTERNHALFLGRGLHFPIALEGALKLKEISYIHAEGYPAGELKHGPLALVDRDMPVVVVAPSDALLQKIRSNMQEVRARGGELFVLTDEQSRIEPVTGMHVINAPGYCGQLSPVVQVIPLQLLAYHTARLRGADVDKPRNLAKSVTVE